MNWVRGDGGALADPLLWVVVAGCQAELRAVLPALPIWLVRFRGHCESI